VAGFVLVRSVSSHNNGTYLNLFDNYELVKEVPVQNIIFLLTKPNLKVLKSKMET
jgi:hypothetical protein